eukprot:SAG31_NODE_2265_length_6057_cov_1.956193_3_plen_125_part_00
MVVAAGLGTSAVAYQTDTGFRRGELFVASIVSGIGSSTIYCAAIAAVHEEAKLKWRAVRAYLQRNQTFSYTCQHSSLTPLDGLALQLAIGACRMAWELGRALGRSVGRLSYEAHTERKPTNSAR